LKVTILSNSRGGVFTATASWVKGLVNKGCDVNVFFLIQSEEAKTLMSSERTHFHYFTASSFFPNLHAFYSFLIRNRPNVLQINFAWFGPLAILKSIAFHTRFILTLHGLPQPWLEPSLFYKIAYTVEHCLLRFVASRSAVVVVVSKYVKKMLKKRYDVDSEVIYHGINSEGYELGNRTEARKKIGYKKTDFIVLFVGKMHPIKDPLTPVRAIHKVVEMNENVHLVMIGEGNLQNQVENEIRKLDLSEHVRFLGLVNHKELKLWYSAANALVLASQNEAFGMVLLEAMASGLPIIASSSGACPEVLGKAGLIFSQGDCEDLARKIMKLASDKELSRTLRNTGLRRVKKVFSWDDKVEKYWKLFREMANETHVH